MKIWIWIAVILLVVGFLLFVVTMTLNRWDFKKLSHAEMTEKTHTFSEPFSEIMLDVTTADIHIQPSEDESCQVICREYEKVSYAVTSQDGKLTIKEEDKREWYDHIGFYFESPKITVYLPEKQYNALMVKTLTGDMKIAPDFAFEKVDITISTGDVHCQDITAEQLKCKTGTGDIYMHQVQTKSAEFSVNTGDVFLSFLTCDTLAVKGNTSDIEMKDVVAAETMTVKNGTGDVEFERCDAKTVEMKTTTGDIDGSFLSGKIFDAKTTTGDIVLPPNDREGGDCTLKTNTGDIDIKIEK